MFQKNSTWGEWHSAFVEIVTIRYNYWNKLLKGGVINFENLAIHMSQIGNIKNIFSQKIWLNKSPRKWIWNFFRMEILLHLVSPTTKFYSFWCPRQPNFTLFLCPRRQNFTPFRCPWQRLLRVTPGWEDRLCGFRAQLTWKWAGQETVRLQ